MSTQKKSADNTFIDRISALYLKLLEEKQDEGEALRSITAFINKALKKVGLSLAADKLEERTQKIAKLAVARAQKAQAEMERRFWLMDVKVGKAGSGYTISFLPEVRIRNTPENRDKWENFLETLAPKTRMGADPKTGTIAILYREGEWLGNLMLADDVRSLHIQDDIHTVNGDLIARGARVVNAAFTASLTVKGDLHIHHELLRQDPPPLVIEGGLSLYGVKSPLGTPFTPEQLIKWGLRAGHRLSIRNDIFVLTPHEGATQSWELAGENVLSTYIWQTGQWRLVRRERIDAAAFDQIHARLSRICLMLGLGADFVAKSVSRTQENIDKIAFYLDLARTQMVKPPAPDDPALAAAASLIDKLARVRAPFSAPMINADTVSAAISEITDEEVTAAGELASRPRHKINEKLIQNDLKYITHLIDEDTDANDLLADGLTTARFLHVTFRSDDSRANLASVAGNIPDLFNGLAEQLSACQRISFERFLEAPGAALTHLRKLLAKDADAIANLDRIENEVRILKQTRPKELIRKVVSVPFTVEDKDFADDKALLNELFAMQKAELKDLPFDAERMVDLLIPRLSSYARERLDIIRAAWKGRPDPKRPMSSAIAEQLRELAPGELMPALRRLMLLVLETVRRYNALSVSPASDAEHGGKQVRAALPADVVMNIRGRLGRACLALGVGRSFIDDYADALVGNLLKLEYFLRIVLGEADAKNECLLDDSGRELTREVLKRFETIRNAAESGTVGDDLHEALKFLKDERLAELGMVLTRPRHLVDVETLRNDVATLRQLSESCLTIDKVFASPGRFLLFMNSCVESKEMKRTVSTFLKPVYFAIAELAKSSESLANLSLNDVLRTSCTVEEAMSRFGDEGDPEARKKLAAGLKQICSKGIADIISHMRKTRVENPPAELERDQEFVASLMAFENAPLDALGLDTRRTAILLLLSLDSFIAAELKRRFESGALEGKDAKSIIKALRADLEWRYAIIRAYNKLSTPAPKKRV
ncbi:hypothetical protein GGQ74_001425 [Desulfobaculum xiamenense]|uniref:Uncharacterized protein n=1 Tax=Desulfobaculum xiamenense TaxID=995050 RepID=A0A846QQW9_9BACT|nr:hypothetical protein [Desulfobaculum xiamenense]NJB67785.1 hypothetical protein [Desulfobaculum xiamenense]